MARINGVQQADAGLKTKLVYRLAPRMMKKLTGREPQTGRGIKPMEIWAYQPKMIQDAAHRAERDDALRRRLRGALPVLALCLSLVSVWSAGGSVVADGW